MYPVDIMNRRTRIFGVVVGIVEIRILCAQAGRARSSEHREAKRINNYTSPYSRLRLANHFDN
jgi:hypothetical protein